MPVVDFTDVAGQVFSAEFSPDAQVHNACDYLADKLGLHPSQIRLLSLNDDKGPKFHPNGSQLFSGESSKFLFQVVVVPPREPDHIPPQDLLAAIAKSTQINNDYRHYSDVIHRIPRDFEQRLQRILEMGFERSEAEEALRNSDYDPQGAIETLTAGPRRGFFERHYGGPFAPPRFFVDDDRFFDPQVFRRPFDEPRPPRDGEGGRRAVPVSPPRPAPSPPPPPLTTAPQRTAPPPQQQPPGNPRMTPELRQAFNRIRRRNQLTEAGFLVLLDDVGGSIEALMAIFDA